MASDIKLTDDLSVRDQLVESISFALRQKVRPYVRKKWYESEADGDADAAAKQIVEYLERSNFTFTKGPPLKQGNWPKAWLAPTGDKSDGG